MQIHVIRVIAQMIEQLIVRKPVRRVLTRTTKRSLEATQRIRALRGKMKLSQLEIGRRVNSSAMSVSRWERGLLEPSAEIYIQLGYLAGDPDCWDFWRRAGLRSEDLMRVVPAIRERLLDNRLTKVQVVVADKSVSKKQISNLVAIPLLPVVAAAPGEEGRDQTDLYEVRPEAVSAAPGPWCPHPEFTTCLRVKGSAMVPLLQSGYIIVVDTSQVNASEIESGDIVVVSHESNGLVVARLMHYDSVEVLVPDNREYESIILSSSAWRVVGKVLWWIGQPVRAD